MSILFWDWVRNRIAGSPPASSPSPERAAAGAEEILTSGFRGIRSRVASEPAVDADALWARIAPQLEAAQPERRTARLAPRRSGLVLAVGALAAGCVLLFARSTAPTRVPVDPTSLGWVRESRLPQPSVDDPLADSTDRLWSALDRAEHSPHR